MLRSTWERPYGTVVEEVASVEKELEALEGATFEGVAGTAGDLPWTAEGDGLEGIELARTWADAAVSDDPGRAPASPETSPMEETSMISVTSAAPNSTNRRPDIVAGRTGFSI